MRKATVKEIFTEVSYLNPSISEISSLGTFVSESSQMVVDFTFKEVMNAINDENSLAYKILFNNIKGNFSDKQLWVIAFELMKNEDYVLKIGSEIEARQRKSQAKADASKEKLANNKSNSQPVLDLIKSNGKKLGDYYTWLKKSNFKKEFFSKKYSITSAQVFLSIITNKQD